MGASGQARLGCACITSAMGWPVETAAELGGLWNQSQNSPAESWSPLKIRVHEKEAEEDFKAFAKTSFAAGETAKHQWKQESAGFLDREEDWPSGLSMARTEGMRRPNSQDCHA